jgi:hypothetical protein
LIPMQHASCDDFYDSVVQSIFGIGLRLETCLDGSKDHTIRDQLDTSIHGLHAIIQRIRERGDLHPDPVSEA